ncbi:hypothetical protein [Neomoorella thermoacetica]|nr:hypothetical protein [Moorella thermoacetica]
MDGSLSRPWWQQDGSCGGRRSGRHEDYPGGKNIGQNNIEVNVKIK